MDKQSIFNKVAAHLIKQGHVSTDTLGACMYRGAEGRMCAVGCLISDKDYAPSIEGVSVRDVRVQTRLPFTPTYSGIALLAELQRAHDHDLRCEGKKKWAQELMGIAAEFNLIVPKQVRELANGDV